MPHIPEPQYECFTCEHYFTRTSALMDGVPAEYATEYCTRACQQQFIEQLEAGAQASKDAGLDKLQRAVASTTSLTGIATRYGLKLGK